MPAYRQSKRNKTDSIVSMTVNAQSLKLKKDDLEIKAKLHKPLLIGVTESWGNEKTEDAVFKLKNYIMYRSDRTGQRGGGTLLYISTQLGQRECLPLKRSVNGIPFDSSVWCWVTPIRFKKILVGCIYRSTSSLGVNNERLNTLLKLACEIIG